MGADIVAFLALAAVVIVTPGQDTALTVRNSLAGGRRAGLSTAAGVASGQAVWTVAASAGLAALVVASEPVFAALRLVGAAYLVWLGVRALADALRRREVAAPASAAARVGGYRQGVLSNLGNPKMAVFFTSLLPQFAPGGGTRFLIMLALGFTFCAMTFAWLSAYAAAVAKAGDTLRRPRVRRSLDALTGALLVAFGCRLASDRR